MEVAVSRDCATALQPGNRVRLCLKKKEKKGDFNYSTWRELEEEGKRFLFCFVLFFETKFQPGVVAHACNPSTLEAKVGGSPEVGRSRAA